MARKFSNLRHMIKVDSDENITIILSPGLFAHIDYNFALDMQDRCYTVFASGDVVFYLAVYDSAEAYLDKTILNMDERMSEFKKFKEMLEKHGSKSCKEYSTGDDKWDKQRKFQWYD